MPGNNTFKHQSETEVHPPTTLLVTHALRNPLYNRHHVRFLQDFYSALHALKRRLSARWAVGLIDIEIPKPPCAASKDHSPREVRNGQKLHWGQCTFTRIATQDSTNTLSTQLILFVKAIPSNARSNVYYKRRAARIL